MTEGYWAVGLGFLGWVLLFSTLWYLSRKERLDPLRDDMERATRNGYPPPGQHAKEVCKEYRADGPTPCKWPYCRCTKGLAS